MAFELLKRSELPVSTFGRRSTEPRVAIQGNGQIQFNVLASEAINGQTHVIVMFDPKSRTMKFIARDKAAKSVPLEDMIELRRGKDGNGTPYFGGAAICKHYGYDHEASGSQSFPAEINTDPKTAKSGPEVSFTLPEGALTPKPKRSRKAKASASGTGNGTVAKAAETAAGETEELTADDDGDLL